MDNNDEVTHYLLLKEMKRIIYTNPPNLTCES
jgi:hypothetical protein